MFNKSEKKKSTAPVFLAIGALAVIGAASITRCGKRAIRCMKDKINSIVKREETN